MVVKGNVISSRLSSTAMPGCLSCWGYLGSGFENELIVCLHFSVGLSAGAAVQILLHKDDCSAGVFTDR